MQGERKRPFFKTYLGTILLCLCFLACSVLFIVLMMWQNRVENLDYLGDVAKRNQTTLLKQIQGDFQTLDGVAICIGEMSGNVSLDMQPILKTINDNNNFIRMGVVDLDGKTNLLDINQSVYAGFDLSRELFFQQALQGEKIVSGTVSDPFEEGEYINYYCVPILRENAVSGVLCAVNSAEIFRAIVDAPVLNGKGYTNIIDAYGQIVIRSSHPDAAAGEPTSLKDMGRFDPDEYVRLLQTMDAGKSGRFSYSVRSQKKIMAVEPMGINNWYVISVIPAIVLSENYWKTILGVGVIILAACLIFMLLFYRQVRAQSRNRANLMHLAYDDPLIGCRNYAKFLLDAAAMTAGSGHRHYAIWYSDIKKFKYFNDLYGYQAGDAALKWLAELFESRSGKGGLFCRVSADNFAGILPYQREDQLFAWFTEISRELSPVSTETSGRLRMELSMGFYCMEDSEKDLSLNEMVNRANMAQKSVKGKNGNHCAIYSSQLREQILWESEIEARGKRALKNGEFVLYMQPKAGIQQNDRIVGAEVLARWNSPEHGLVSPGEFIPVFEKSGMIVELDRFMFEHACQWLQGYMREGNPSINVAVNVSRLGLFQEDFLEYYTSVKRQYGIPDGMLELEFTESVVLNDYELFRNTVIALQNEGFLCSLDDFGSGYSSLNMLKELPIDVLKLDILFFRKDADVQRERIVVSHIVAMAKELGIVTIAEGVEDPEQVLFLRQHGCDIVQGYVYSKPIPLEAFDVLLRSLREKSLPMAKK